MVYNEVSVDRTLCIGICLQAWLRQASALPLHTSGKLVHEVPGILSFLNPYHCRSTGVTDILVLLHMTSRWALEIQIQVTDVSSP